MERDEFWLTKWQEAIDFLETYHRKPSKFVPEECNMRSWWKQSKQKLGLGEKYDTSLIALTHYAFGEQVYSCSYCLWPPVFWVVVHGGSPSNGIVNHR